MESVFHDLLTELLTYADLVRLKCHAHPVFASSRRTFCLPDVIISPVCTY